MADTQETVEPDAELAHLSAEFFQIQHSTDPFSATLLGVPGFDGLVPDPSRAGAARNAAKIRQLERRLERIDPSGLNSADRINHAVLGRLAWGARSEITVCACPPSAFSITWTIRAS